jgi:hypothetical protein
VLVIDEDPTRVELVALAARASTPDGDVVVLDAMTHDAASAIVAVKQAAHAPGRTVVIVRAGPASWTAAAVLATLRPPLHHGQVDAVVIAEGPRETLPVLITDFPGLRLLPPHSDTQAVIGELLTANDANGSKV